MSTAGGGGGGAAPPLEYRVSARAVHGGDAEVTAAQIVVPLDAAWATPPTGAPGPADLLGSAFAACLLKNLARSGALLGFEYDDAQVDVVLRRQDTPPKFVSVQYAMRIATEEPQRRIELVHTNLRKFGPWPQPTSRRWSFTSRKLRKNRADGGWLTSAERRRGPKSGCLDGALRVRRRRASGRVKGPAGREHVLSTKCRDRA